MNTKLELWLPFERSVITQPFAANANPLYAGEGLKGHSAIDWGAPWGANGYNCADEAYCYSTMNKDHSDPMKYRAVCTIVETQLGVYEVMYGHCSDILAVVGKTYKPGELIYRVGNTGPVYAGGKEVTKAEKLAGSRAGSHGHCPQVRVLKKVKVQDKTKRYISSGNGLLKKNGYYYEIVNYDNGYNGCIDPAPFFNGFLAQNAPQVLSTYQQIIDLLKKKLGL